jgi:hypothetical protein
VRPPQCIKSGHNRLPSTRHVWQWPATRSDGPTASTRWLGLGIVSTRKRWVILLYYSNKRRWVLKQKAECVRLTMHYAVYSIYTIPRGPWPHAQRLMSYIWSIFVSVLWLIFFRVFYWRHECGRFFCLYTILSLYHIFLGCPLLITFKVRNKYILYQN